MHITISNEKLYIGECKYCVLEITLEEAKLLATQFQSYDNIEKKDLKQVLKAYLAGCLLKFKDNDSIKVDGFIDGNIDFSIYFPKSFFE